jgi:transcriptional regulator with XRE-family HTH domain
VTSDLGDVCERLGKRIRKLRLKHGWTQTYLAVHTGLGRPFISNIERGQKEPCLRSLEILAIAFEISLSQLMRGV